MSIEEKPSARPPARDTDPEKIERGFQKAREAGLQWRRFSLTQRVGALRGFWDALLREREELAALINDESGKPMAEIQAMEIDGAGLILKYFTRNAHRILKDRAAPTPWLLFNKRAYVRRTPLGVAALITPWNMPFLIAVGDMIPALLAGNAVVIKPSEWTTRVMRYVERKFNACGLFPEGLLQVVEGGGAAGELVLEEADMVVFTGSCTTGRKVAAAAGRRLIPCVLELGGLHSMVVAKDAPMERTVRAAVWGRFANSGQVCVGVESALVVEEIYGEFCRRVEEEAGKLRQGPGPGYDVDLGRLIFPGQLDVVERHLADAREKGARVVGGKVLDREGLVVEPAIVFDATDDMLVMKEETFGPVLAVSPIVKVEDAIRFINAGDRGLAASVWTSDLPAGEDWAAMIESGLVSVNDVLSHYVVCSLPFGGIKQSGLGRRHSDDGLRMFTVEQSVIVHEWPSNAPDFWWFPYGELKSRLLTFLAKLS